ncbi:hypothetical protein AB1Y20_002194 [Prymnesium parvum]|uniref:Uncharacterized protein n=1 Tax=Prymnesium parvum TaxID=97485 RepID=A0AB34JAK3_PRYPA
MHDLGALQAYALGRANAHSLLPTLPTLSHATELYSTAGLHATQLPPNVSASIIPKHLFTFWSPPDEIPDFPAACIAEFKRLNPEWTVHILHPGIAGLEPPPFQNINADNDGSYASLHHVAQWYGAAALARFGGVWVEPTSIPLRPLESWVEEHRAAVQGWPLGHVANTIDSYALAAPARSALMYRWWSELRLAWKVGVGTYCENLPSDVTVDLRERLPQATWHASFRQSLASGHADAVAYRPTATAPAQPLQWLHRFNFDGARAVDWLFANASSGGATPAELSAAPFLRLRPEDYARVGDLYARAAQGSYLAQRLVNALPPRPPSLSSPPPPSPPPATRAYANLAVGAPKFLSKLIRHVRSARGSPSIEEIGTTPTDAWLRSASPYALPLVKHSGTELATTFPNEVITTFPSPDLNTIPPPPPPLWQFEGSQTTGQEADSPTLLALPTEPAHAV